MRQFLLGRNVAYASATNLGTIPEGAVGFYYNDNGIPKADATGDKVKTFKEAMVVLGRPAEKGGPVVLPFFNKNFSYSKGVYQVATTFEAKVTVTAPGTIGDCSIIVARKGVKFNERNKWTAMVYVKDADMTAANLATALVKSINDNISSGVTATSSEAVVTIKATKAGVDYEIIGADNLQGASVTITTRGLSAYGDAEYVKDLAEKAAADAGFEYTYRDNYELYPTYPLNPLKANDVADTGFTIFTLKFAEPRRTKTVDEVVNQVIQVAFPTDAAAITTFEKVCKTIAGEATT